MTVSKPTEMRWAGKVLDKELTEVKIIVLSDLHYGNPYCSLIHFLRTIEFIKKQDNTYCFLNGDLLEAITKVSKGDIYKQKLTPQEQRNDVMDMLKPIQDKILGATIGNHENRIYDETGVDLMKDIAKELKIPYRPEGMLFKLSFGDNNNRTKGKPFVFWSYMTHGYGGARTKSAKAVKVERTAAWVSADWYALSHDHVVNVAPDVYLEGDDRGIIDKETGFLTGRLRAKRIMLVKTNAFLKWGGYAERNGFSPSDLCTPLIQLLTPTSKIWEMYPDKPRQAVKVIV